MSLVAFRVDSSPRIGAGHLMRCLTLADALQERGAEVHFLCRNHRGHLGSLIDTGKYALHLLPSEKCGSEVSVTSNVGDKPVNYESWLGENTVADARACSVYLAEILASRRLQRCQLLVVDHYGIDQQWEQLLRPQTETLAVIDDLANRPHQCDFIIDQTLAREIRDYRPYVNDATCLLGPDYALLRPEFARLRGSALSGELRSGSKKRLLISMGGTDPDNYTARLLVSLSQIAMIKDYTLDVVLGKNAPWLDDVGRLALELELNIDLHRGASNMAELMARAELAIGAPGSAAWERCCLGLASIIVPIADNQQQVASALDEARASLLLSPVDLEDPARLQLALGSLLEHIEAYRVTSARICDGAGAQRVAQRLLPRQTKDGQSVNLVPANSTDAALIFDWQRQPETRKYARTPQPPSWKQHCDWFEARLAADNCHFYVIYQGNKPAGVVRLDAVDHPLASHEVSIFIDPDNYGKGLAGIALRLVRELHPFSDIVATVLAGNTASHALFSSRGYQRVDKTTYLSKGKGCR